jgi:hypothetical protein
MNYEKIYKKLIETAKLLNRIKGLEYYENHHILPKCLGGNNKKENLVLLTAKEHFLAHLLLVQMYDGKDKAKLSFALFQMCRKNKLHGRIVSSRQFEKAKQIMSENCRGENGSFYGKKHTDEVKELQRQKMLNNNPSKNGVWNKGKKTKPLSEEHKLKLSESLKGHIQKKETKEKISNSHKGKSKSKEHRLKLSEALKGKKLSDETKLKMSLNRKNKKQKILVCPYCNMSGGTTMYRWHFENCKNKLYERE